MEKADVINFPSHSSLGLHIRGSVVLKDGCTASRWRVAVDRTGGLGEGSPPPLLCGPIFAVPSSFSLCRQLLITPHWSCRACLGLLWFPPPPRALLHLPNLSSSGDRNEMPTTIGAAMIWRRGCRLPQGAKTPWNRRSESLTPLP